MIHIAEIAEQDTLATEFLAASASRLKKSNGGRPRLDLRKDPWAVISPLVTALKTPFEQAGNAEAT